MRHHFLRSLLVAAAALPAIATAATLQAGSKRFTESYILGEIVAQTARSAGAQVAHQRGLGNTGILLNALESGSIDIYPEYTGTIAREILKLDSVPPLAELNVQLARRGLAAGVPLGFNNTYALAIRTADARAKSISRISELKAHPELRLGLSQEFLGRADGWPGLARAYGFASAPPKGIDHGLAYEAIAKGQVDVIDIYSTDAKLDKYQLTVLVDDAGFFPRYDAVLLYRADLPARFPQPWAAIAKLEGRIDAATMRHLNTQAELDNVDFARVAAGWLAQATGAAEPVPRSQGSEPQAAPSLWARIFAPDFGRLALEHVALVFAALAASCLIGIPVGVLAARRRRAAPAVFGVVGTIQTIPALALLAFLIPITGRIGPVPAFIALTLYALLPIVRNTHTAITQIPREMIEAAEALGLQPAAIVRKIELPLATPTVLAGIKTSAVVNVGTATIAAFIGAGGFGERIVTGLALNDTTTLLAGAIPVAVLALLVQGAFDLLERRIVPAGLRGQRA
ncbi:MAG TPA: glycine betaine ABC transporter substrate-binding protein [Burkholderiaceae bacterium]|nr:glycine betaine ABC transporter substrate-binding protein [Burkholderiaceae bacterium]